METPVQEREPPVDYKLSLQHGRVQWKDPGGPYGVGKPLCKWPARIKFAHPPSICACLDKTKENETLNLLRLLRSIFLLIFKWLHIRTHGKDLMHASTSARYFAGQFQQL